MARTKLGRANLVIRTDMSKRVSITPNDINPATVLGLFAFNADDVLDGVQTLTILDASSAEGYDLEGGALLTALSFPNLTTLGTTGQLYLDGMPILTTLSVPLLAATSDINITHMNALTAIAFPALTTCSSWRTTNNPQLTSISLGALATLGGEFDTFTCPNLTTLSLPSLTTFASDIQANGCALNQASVDGILAALVAIPTWGTGGQTCSMTGGTNSAPSVGGAADKATLIARGATVHTN